VVCTEVSNEEVVVKKMEARAEKVNVLRNKHFYGAESCDATAHL